MFLCELGRIAGFMSFIIGPAVGQEPINRDPADHD